MSEKISIPYKFSKHEHTIIGSYFSTHTDWEKSIFDDIKENLKEHLRVQQDNKCCYCKRELGFDIKEVDIEHIIPKSRFEKFTFHHKNLALSCPGCNTKKSTSCVLLNVSITNYPSSGSNFKIIHAYYDDYSTHIKVDDGCIYIAKSKKGSETITICELFRLSTAEENAKKFKISQSPMSQLVENMRKAKTESPELFEELKMLLNG
ncbi:MAG: hypothetical protein EOM50_15510 [Erysipelotrichia bacterium]|nr:hypothetical protein [Erysipelotrichia bacterium]